MIRWLPFPGLSVALLIAWLLLVGSVAPGSLLFGAFLAVTLSWVLVRLELPTLRFRRPFAALRLAVNVLREIIRSNNAVARIILSRGTRKRRSGFVRIPLDTYNPYVLAGIACIITATPGTLWVEYDSADNTMLLHVLDLIDEDEWVEIVKTRYETRLVEIFG